MMISLFETVEKNWGKGENACDQHFLLFPQCFQKHSISGSLKLRNVCFRNVSSSISYGDKDLENTVGEGENADNPYQNKF